MDWEDKKQVQELMALAIAIQTKLWVEFDANQNRNIAVGDVFPAPIFHAGLGFKVIMFSIHIDGLTALEIVVFKFSDTGRIAVDLYDGEKATPLARIGKMSSHIDFAGMETLIESIKSLTAREVA